MKAYVLVVEDDALIGETFVAYFRTRGYKSELAQTIEAATERYWSDCPDVILIDNNMPDGLGIEFVKIVRSCDPVTKLIVVTANGQAQNAVDALKNGANDYLVKPVSLEKIASCLEKLLDRDQLSLNSHNQPSSLRGGKIAHLAGNSPQIGNLRSLIQGIIRNERESPLIKASPVLIMGETGTGKSLIARTLHYEGPRRSFPCIEVSCNSIAEQSADEILFHSGRGDFTANGRPKVGLFPAAEGGTLIFDSIEDLPMAVQGTILHVLQDVPFWRQGSISERSCDARLIATTAVDLRERVRHGRFRPELLYRLDVMSICTTPLREIPDDIEIIANYLIDEMRTKYNRDDLEISAVSLDQMLKYSWPGNVRELSNHLERRLMEARSSDKPDASMLDFNPILAVDHDSHS